MRILNILNRESPLLLAREAVWRVRRHWNKKRLPNKLLRPGHVEFRPIPYFRPDLNVVDSHFKEIIVAYAHEIRAGRYPFFGYPTANLGTRPSWKSDFVSGAVWPETKYRGYEFIRNDGSDVKVPYELSRLQFLPVLGKAHRLTGDEAYRQAAKELLTNWIESNPVLAGVNWTSAMEAALRGMSICFLLSLLFPFRPEEQEWHENVTRSLMQHLLFIEAHIEFSHLLTSNHYLSDVVGLYCLSQFLDGEGMAARRPRYRRLIEAEMAKQVYEDGGDYEASSGYHVFVTQLFTTALLLMRADSPDLPKPAYVERLRRMYGILNALASSSGELPHIGDCDDGRTELLVSDLQQMMLLPVAERNSLRVPQLLGLGQRLFGVGAGPSDDAAWFGLCDTDRVPYPGKDTWRDADGTVRILPNSGIAILRNQSAELLFFAIPNGISGKGSHTHNDKLSFVLRIGGKDVLCDSGTGWYTRDAATRNQFRNTAAHNTVMIDALEQNLIEAHPSGLFVLGNQATVSPIQEGLKSWGRYVRASHAGYWSVGVTHTRTIRVMKDEPTFVVDDLLSGSGEHDFEFNLQLPPSRVAFIEATENCILCFILGDRHVWLTVSGPGGLEASLEPSSISATYGAIVPSSRLRIRGRAALPTLIATRISWEEISGAKDGAHHATEQSVPHVATTEVVHR